DHGAGRATGRQQRSHTAFKMRVIAALRVDHAVAVAEGHGALAEALQHHGVEPAALCEIDRWLKPVGGKTGAGSDAECRHGRVRDSTQSPFNPSIPGKNRSPTVYGVCLIEPIFAMNCAVFKTF